MHYDEARGAGRRDNPDMAAHASDARGEET